MTIFAAQFCCSAAARVVVSCCFSVGVGVGGSKLVQVDSRKILGHFKRQFGWPQISSGSLKHGQAYLANEANPTKVALISLCVQLNGG